MSRTTTAGAMHQRALTRLCLLFSWASRGKPKVRWASLVGLIVLPIVLAACGVVLLDTYRHQLTLEHRLGATQGVRDEAYRLLGLATQAEAGERGFLISGNESALAPYRAALNILPGLQAHLAGSATDPQDRQVLAALSEPLDRRLKRLAAAIQLRRTSHDPGMIAQLDGPGDDQLMAAVRTGVGGLVRLQDDRGRLLQEALNRTGDRTTLLIVFRLMCMAILIAATTALIAMALRDRDAHALKLRRAGEEADAANRAKSEFLANMSHEIRTPLNGVLTMAQLMARDELIPRQREKLDVIQASSADLLHVINDILDVSKIEAGKLELEIVAFDPVEVLETVLAGFRPMAERKGIGLTLEIAPCARGLRLGDPARLRQIVNNLVSNALKFTAHGGVEVRLKSAALDRREGLILAVHDTGVGVAPEKMALLFQKFSQVDASTTRQFGGTGLGLAICRELATLMGGRVWAESKPGVGSTFHATLRLPSAGEVFETLAPETLAPEILAPEILAVPAGSETADNVPRRGTRVLAAEDNPTNQLVLSTIMELFGFELTLVGDGRQAVAAWADGDFDLILMDVQMPVMDGVAATRLIRETETRLDRPRTPIVALSANAYHHQIAEYEAAGMDAHVAKPIELTRLQAVVEAALAGEAAAPRLCA
ncbi:MAG: ATP-binding protein [Caulobacteraceae bacterium]